MNLRHCRRARQVCLLAAAFLVAAPFAAGQVSVTMEHYDQARTGANLSETQLNTTNVNSSQFGKSFSYTVDGSIYAQPLYVPALSIPGKGTHNVLYAVTMNDVVYAFDADSNSTLWSVDFRNAAAGVSAIPITDIVGSNSLNIVGNVGVESTPVIDLTTDTIYLVVRTKEVSGSTTSYVARLHALNITTGAEKFGGPTLIQASVPGTGNGSSGGTLTLDTFITNQRSSLVLANGSVLFAWASHEDDFAWHGWVLAYGAQSLKRTAVYCFTPNGTGGGSWMAGRAPAVDSSGNVYYMSGNGDWDGNEELSDSIVKFSTAGGISVSDYFTPDNYAALQSADEDLGSSGPMLIPGTDLIIGGGKQSLLYLTHTGNMGHEQSGNGQIPQSLPSGGSGYLTGGGPSFWNRTTGAGPTMYVWPDGSALTAFHFNGTTFDTEPISQSTISGVSGFATGAAVTISANGSTAGTGIVWASMPTASAGHGTAPGLLRAFDANNLTTELWDSTINATQDNTGTWAKFVPPTVANGKVYVASFSNTLSVFGLTSTTPDFTIGANPSSQSAAQGGSTSYQVSIGAVNAFSSTVNLSVTGLPANATGSFNPATLASGASSTLTVNAAATTPVGTYTLTITGISGGLTHTATVSLNVTSAGSTSSSGVISINFVGKASSVMGSTEIAGVIPESNWNQAAGVSGSLALVDNTGASAGASVSWSAPDLWVLPITDAPGNARMMEGYLDTNGANAVVTVSALPANSAGYDIYVYTDGDNAADTRTGAYTISGSGITTTTINATDAANTNFSGTFTQASNSSGNYVKFTIAATGFTLTASPVSASDGVLRAPVNGMQIVPHAGSTPPPSPDFSISASPSSQTATAGNPTTYTVTVAALNGFTGTVALSASGQPSGATPTFAPPSITSSGSSTLTVSTGSATTTGTSTITITGSSSTLTHSTLISLTVNSVPTAAMPTFTPAAGTYTTAQSVTLSSTTPSNTIFYTLDGTAPGTTSTKYAAAISVSTNVTIKAIATASGLANSAVASASYVIGTAAPPPSTGIMSVNFVGKAATAMASTEVAGVVPEADWNQAAGVSGSLALVDNTGASTGASVSWSAPNLWVLPITDAAGNARMMEGYLDTNGANAVVTVSALPANSAGYDVYVYTDGDNAGDTRTGGYSISGSGITTTTINATDAANTNFSGSFTQANNSSGNYVKFTVVATSFTVTASPVSASDGVLRAPVNGMQIVPHGGSTPPPPTPDFSVAASPSSQSVTAGNSTTYTVTTTALNGFASTVALSASGLPTGATGTFAPPSITGSGSSTLTVSTGSATPAGSPTVTITASSGSLTHSATVTLSVTASGSGSSAKAISINFVGKAPSAMAATETAGVVPKSNWNQLSGVSGTGHALVDETGSATGATVNWSAPNLWDLPITDAAGNIRMMEGYLDTNGANAVVTVSGLPASSTGYDIYVYTDGDNAADVRTAGYTISGSGITTTTIDATDAANANFSGTFTQAINSNGNYVKFTVTATSFTITASPVSASDGVLRAPVNGIQIVPH